MSVAMLFVFRRKKSAQQRLYHPGMVGCFVQVGCKGNFVAYLWAVIGYDIVCGGNGVGGP